MPTGYTSIIEGGNPTFKEYAMRCARAFGAFVHMREDDLNAPLTPAKPDTGYAEKRLEECEEELAELEALSDKEVYAICAAMDKQAVEYWVKRESERKAKLAKYDAMIAQVKAWVPPTNDHHGIKQFMLDQIEVSTRYERRPSERPEPIDPRDYKAEEIAHLRERIGDYHKEIADGFRRCNERNKWAEDLVASL